MKNLTEIEKEKNNELFANSLTLKIVWKNKFLQLLESGWYEKQYIDNYYNVINKFLLNYEKVLENTLTNLKK